LRSLLQNSVIKYRLLITTTGTEFVTSCSCEKYQNNLQHPLYCGKFSGSENWYKCQQDRLVKCPFCRTLNKRYRWRITCRLIHYWHCACSARDAVVFPTIRIRYEYCLKTKKQSVFRNKLWKILNFGTIRNHRCLENVWPAHKTVNWLRKPTNFDQYLF